MEEKSLTGRRLDTPDPTQQPNLTRSLLYFRAHDVHLQYCFIDANRPSLSVRGRLIKKPRTHYFSLAARNATSYLVPSYLIIIIVVNGIQSDCVKSDVNVVNCIALCEQVKAACARYTRVGRRTESTVARKLRMLREISCPVFKSETAKTYCFIRDENPPWGQGRRD